MSLLNKHTKFPRYPKSASSLSALPKYEPQVAESMEKQSYYDMHDSDIHDSSIELPPFDMPLQKQAMPSSARPSMATEPLEKPTFPSQRSSDDLSRLDLPLRLPGNYDLRAPIVQESAVQEPYFERKQERTPEAVTMLQDNEPIYVKLEEYKKAVRNISFIRDKLDEAEQILVDIMQLKKEEDQQMMDWHKEITEIKNKLMEVDRGLFEVHK